MLGQVVSDGHEPLAVKDLEGERIVSRWTRGTSEDEVKSLLELGDGLTSGIDCIKGMYHRHHIGFQTRWPLPITTIPFGWTRGTVGKVDVGHGSLIRNYGLIVLLRLGGMQDELA